MQDIIKKLDLEEYILKLQGLFAREKSVILQGDINIHHKLIKEISNYNFKQPLSVENLDEQLIKLTKQATLKLDEIYQFVKIINYFLYVLNFELDGKLKEWIEKIIIPVSLQNISKSFDTKGNILQGVSEELDNINIHIYNNKQNIKDSLYKIMNNKKLQPYLIDHQVHLVHSQQTILVRGGFNHFLKAKVLDRSNAGFFYVVPHSIEQLKQKQEDLLNTKDELILKLAKEYSGILLKNLPFLKFINKEFDRFDHYLARVNFAKTDDKNFILPTKNIKNEKLVDFVHPALHKAKPVNIDCSKKVIMITGVNAGGKTMLLKSILSAAFMAKYLIPFKAHHTTKIGHYKNILAVLDDPQSVKNDISTFAGRMVEFSKLFTKNNAIVGVDEIELGTDSDEAASLFKVIIEHLIKKDIKIIITTHHKRLASLMASYDEVELIAALYDEKNRQPTYQFLQGTIGQSYAFETALRYGIALNIVNEAKDVYGKDKDKLNDLIARSSKLELEYKKKLEILDNKIAKNDRLKKSLQDEKEKVDKTLQEYKQTLQKEYDIAIDEAKKAIKATSSQEAHRFLNKAHQKSKSIKIDKVEQQNIEFKVGDRVKYNETKGVILSIKGKKVFFQSDAGMKIQVLKTDLKPSGNPIKPKIKPKTFVKVAKPQKGDIQIDLHGQRADEAIENLDKFLSDCLINGFDEILVYHGIGTGKLSHAVKEFLRIHPKVADFTDAPYNQGGYGATLVRL